MIRLSTRYLADHGVEAARLEAELLSAHSLGLRRLDLYLQHDRPLREAELAPIRALLRRRAAGEPVAHLVGEREFYGRAFTVSAAVLIPRPETELLVERVVAWARAENAPVRICDAGTGSGCIAVSLACELPTAELVATDASPEAAAVAGANARRHGVGDRVRVEVGAWGEPLRGLGPFDVLVSNPPYVTSAELAELPRDVRDHEPVLALDGGPDGLHAYRELAGGVVPLVRPGGLVALEVDPRRAAAVAALLPGEVAIRPDLAGRDRLVEAVLPGGGPG